MRKPLLSLAVLCFAAFAAMAQNAPREMVCEVHINKVKPGMTAQYEQGRTKHMAWHKSQNDSWNWDTFEITTGEHTGDYLISSCGHAWTDFDAREKFNVADGQNANATMGASMAGETMSYYVLRSELSSISKPGTPLPAYFSVVFFHLKPEGVMDFRNAVSQVNEAFTKTNTPHVPSYWYTLANGGSGPEMVLVQERKSIGEMAPASPKTLDEMMKEAYSDQGATIMMTLRKSYYRSESELLHYRPDLSYTAPATK
jgi:hypothetical protein